MDTDLNKNTEETTENSKPDQHNIESSTTYTQIVKTNADNAIVSAQTAKENADAATISAQSAKINCESAAIHAKNADTSAQSAKTSADAATMSANTSKDNCESTVTHAKNAHTNAQAAKTSADAAAMSANTAKDNCESAVTHAKNADTSAQSAKTSADAATMSAQAAKENNESAAASSKNIYADAQAAKANAEATKNSCESAAVSADQAEKEFRNAEISSKKAQQEAEGAAQAHNMSTTIGLAGAFNKKARSATHNLYLWSFALIITLSSILLIGYSKIDKVLELIQQLIGKGDIYAIIGVEIFYFISTAAPLIWFAWLSTKMISKYFHLVEDYSYKATISQAYIGFKEQANGLDPIFQERLFAAAITQLDANPLRFFESSTLPGSPLQDLLQQPFIQSALQEPNFKENFTKWIKSMFKTNFHLPKNSLLKNTQLSAIPTPVASATSSSPPAT